MHWSLSLPWNSSILWLLGHHFPLFLLSILLSLLLNPCVSLVPLNGRAWAKTCVQGRGPGTFNEDRGGEGRRLKDNKGYIMSSTDVGNWAQFHGKHLISRSSPDTILTWVLPKSRIRDKDLWAGILFWNKSRMQDWRTQDGDRGKEKTPT